MSIESNLTECYMEQMSRIISDDQTIVMTLELGNQIKIENHLWGFQLERIDKKQFLKSLKAKQDLIETFSSFAKSK